MDWNVQWDYSGKGACQLEQSWERCGIELLSRVLNDVQKFPVLEATWSHTLRFCRCLFKKANRLRTRLCAVVSHTAFAAYASIVSYIHPAIFVPSISIRNVLDMDRDFSTKLPWLQRASWPWWRCVSYHKMRNGMTWAVARSRMSPRKQVSTNARSGGA